MSDSLHCNRKIHWFQLDYNTLNGTHVASVIFSRDRLKQVQSMRYPLSLSSSKYVVKPKWLRIYWYKAHKQPLAYRFVPKRRRQPHSGGKWYMQANRNPHHITMSIVHIKYSNPIFLQAYRQHSYRLRVMISGKLEKYACVYVCVCADAEVYFYLSICVPSII